MTGITVHLIATYSIFVSQPEIKELLDLPSYKDKTAETTALEIAQNKLECDGIIPDSIKVTENTEVST